MTSKDRKILIKVLKDRIYPHVIPDDVKGYSNRSISIMNSMILLKILEEGEQDD